MTWICPPLLSNNSRPKTAAPQIACTTTTTATTTTTTTTTQTGPNPQSSVPFRSRFQCCAASTSLSSLSSQASLPTITCSLNWASSEDSLSRFMFHSPPVHSTPSPEPSTTTPWSINGSSSIPASLVISQPPTTLAAPSTTTLAPRPQATPLLGSLASSPTPISDMFTFSFMSNLSHPLSAFAPSQSRETPHTLSPATSLPPVGDMFTLSSRSSPLPYSSQVSSVSSLLTRGRAKSSITPTTVPPPTTDQGNTTTFSTTPDRTISCIQNQNIVNHDRSLGLSATRDPTGALTSGHPTPIPWLSSRSPSPSSAFSHSRTVSPTSLPPSAVNSSRTPIADLYKRSDLVFTTSKSPPSLILDSRPELSSQQQQLQQQQDNKSSPINKDIFKGNPRFQNVNHFHRQPNNLEENHRRGPSEATSSSTLLQSDDDDENHRKWVLDVVLKKTTEDKEDKNEERPHGKKVDRASVMTVLATGGRLSEWEWSQVAGTVRSFPKRKSLVDEEVESI